MSDFEHRQDFARIPGILAAAPVEGDAFMKYNKSIERDGAIPRKYRELIALGVALTTQCVYCVDVHTTHAKAHGVTPEEMAELAFIAAAVRAGGTLGHSLLAMRMYEQAPVPSKDF